MRIQPFVLCFALDFGQIIVYLSYHIGADKVTGDSWQLVSAIHGECDTLMV